MNSRTAIVGMGLLAVVAIVALENGDAGGNWITDGFAAAPTYTHEQLRSFPRQPLPLTSPGTWIVSDDYPQMALNNDLEGNLEFKVDVDPLGEVTDCTITRSSGVAAFDSKACATVMTRARFYPALDEEQQVTAGSYSTTVRWVIED